MRAAGPVFGALDGLGGALLGTVAGLAVVLVLGFVAKRAPLPPVRQAAQGSSVLALLDERLPPGPVGRALLRLDPPTAAAGKGVSVPEPPAEVSGVGPGGP